MDDGSPLKTNPLEPSTALTPSWAAAARKLLGSLLEISNSERANPSGRELSSVGYSIFADRRVDMWQLNKSTAPSSVPSDMIWRDRKSTRLNSSHVSESRMPSSA